LPAVPGAFGSLTPYQDGLLFTPMLDDQTAGLFARKVSASNCSARIQPPPRGRPASRVIAGRWSCLDPRAAAGRRADHRWHTGRDDRLPLAADPSRPSSLAAWRHLHFSAPEWTGSMSWMWNPFDGVEPSHLSAIRALPDQHRGTASRVEGDLGRGTFRAAIPTPHPAGDHVYFFATPLVTTCRRSRGFFRRRPGCGRPTGPALELSLSSGSRPSSPGWCTDHARGLSPGISGSRFYFGGQSPAVPLGDELWKSSGSALAPCT